MKKKEKLRRKHTELLKRELVRRDDVIDRIVAANRALSDNLKMIYNEGEIIKALEFIAAVKSETSPQCAFLSSEFWQIPADTEMYIHVPVAPYYQHELKLSGVFWWGKNASSCLLANARVGNLEVINMLNTERGNLPRELGAHAVEWHSVKPGMLLRFNIRNEGSEPAHVHVIAKFQKVAKNETV